MPNVSTGSTKAIADTNILLYAFDTAETIKHPIADRLLKELIRESRLALSVQNLNEFYNIITRPDRAFSMSHEEAKSTLQHFATVSDVYPLTPETSFLAFDAIARYGMSLWDALIWAVAKQNNLTTIYTEDLQSAPDIEGVRYINPFVGSSP